MDSQYTVSLNHLINDIPPRIKGLRISKTRGGSPAINSPDQLEKILRTSLDVLAWHGYFLRKCGDLLFSLCRNDLLCYFRGNGELGGLELYVEEISNGKIKKIFSNMSLNKESLQESEDCIFLHLEIGFHLVSKPEFLIESPSGTYKYKFSDGEGQKEYVNRMNVVLNEYKDEYQMNKNGQIERRMDPETHRMCHSDFSNPWPDDKVKNQIEAAVGKVIRREANTEDWKDAAKQLAGVLEFIRMKSEYLSPKDQKDLCLLVNKLLRHNDPEQYILTNLLSGYKYMFRVYLSTILWVLDCIREDPNSQS